jgi:hypothetical protein
MGAVAEQFFLPQSFIISLSLWKVLVLHLPFILPDASSPHHHSLGCARWSRWVIIVHLDCLLSISVAAMSLNIVFGGKLGNITASQFLDIPNSNVKTDASCCIVPYALLY